MGSGREMMGDGKWNRDNGVLWHTHRFAGKMEAASFE
jgi:hypothetical protein